MQKFVEKARSLLSRLSVIQLSYDDFAAFYAPIWAIAAFLIIPSLMVLGVRADWWVLNGALAQTTDDPDKAWWLSLVFALIISLIVTLCGFMAVNIREKKLHKKQCLNKDNKTIDNPHWRHHRSQLRVFEALLTICMIITLALSGLTYIPARVEAKPEEQALLSSQNSRQNDLSGKINSERKLIIDQFRSDSIAIARGFAAKYKAKAGRNGVKLQVYKNELNQLNRELQLKSTTALRKQGLRGRIAELNKILIPRHEGNVIRQTAKTVAEHSQELEDLRLGKNTQLLAISQRYARQDSLHQNTFIVEASELSNTITSAAFSTMGYNIIINALLLFFVRGLAKYLWGATHGVKTIVYEKIGPPESTNGNGNNLRGKTNKTKTKPPTKQKPNSAKQVATRVSDDMSLAELQAAKRDFKSKLSPHLSHKRNDKKRKNTDYYIEKYQKAIEDVDAKIEAKKNENKSDFLGLNLALS